MNQATRRKKTFRAPLVFRFSTSTEIRQFLPPATFAEARQRRNRRVVPPKMRVRQRAPARVVVSVAAHVYAAVTIWSKHSYDLALLSPHVFFRSAAAPLAFPSPNAPPIFRPPPRSLLLLFVPRIRRVHLRPNLPRPTPRCCHRAAHRHSHCHHDFPPRPRRLRPRLVPGGMEHALRQAHFSKCARAPHNGQWRRSHAGMVGALFKFVS